MTPDEVAHRFAAEISDQAPLLERDVEWPNVRLHQRTYVSQIPLPKVLVSSVRAVVFRGSRVVVIRDRWSGLHVIPGGRREPGEGIEQTVRREVLEECGWLIGAPASFAFHHFRYLGERPAGFTYPWRDFIQPIFLAEAERYRRGALKRAGEIEIGSRLTPYARALRDLPEDQQLILKAARSLRR